MTTSESVDARLLPSFERRFVDLPAGRVLALVGGSGPPLLMLHGDPQTHLCWHRMAPALATRFTVVLTDLRGRGESHAPAPSPDAASNPYAKRVTAAEQLELMQALGFERFALVGHDRGARVARRLALDHPDAVTRLVVMDVVPALDLYESVTAHRMPDARDVGRARRRRQALRRAGGVGAAVCARPLRAGAVRSLHPGGGAGRGARRARRLSRPGRRTAPRVGACAASSVVIGDAFARRTPGPRRAPGSSARHSS